MYCIFTNVHNLIFSEETKKSMHLLLNLKSIFQNVHYLAMEVTQLELDTMSHVLDLGMLSGPCNKLITYISSHGSPYICHIPGFISNKYVLQEFRGSLIVTARESIYSGKYRFGCSLNKNA